MKVRLFTQEIHVAGRYGYSAVDADYGSRCIETGMTKKAANTLASKIRQEIQEFCKANELATLLNAVEHYMRHHDPETKQVIDTWLMNHSVMSEPCDIPDYVVEEQRALEVEARTTYLSIDNERYSREYRQRKAKQAEVKW